MARHKPHLVWKHLERVSAKIFDDFKDVIAKEVSKENGVYALYKDDRLYYVGLAKNLKARLKAHLRDRHNGKWNVFSVYLTTSIDHLRELEALVLRIVRTKGNKVRGNLKGSTDLRRSLKKQLKERVNAKVEGIFGRKPRAKRDGGKADLKGDLKQLAGHVKLPARLRTVYKGETYRATLRRDGSVRWNGKLYRSLSHAGRAVTKRPTNGWSFWRCERGKGYWVKLNKVRR